MNRVKDETDERMIPKDQIDSPSIDEGSCGGSFGRGGGGVILKKGPWTSAEDAILVEYVRKHGEGNWNAVQRHSGLSRCGKSCRLRWANHLRPYLKKGAFTQEEERLIIELHSRIGNKWARMANLLKGRTDNEIKNYWNTRIKRRQRANLPLYPPELSFEASNENLLGQDVSEFNSIDRQHHGALHGSTFDVNQDGLFDNFRAGQGALLYGSAFSVSGMYAQGFDSKNFGVIGPAVNPLKRPWESETLFSGIHYGFNCGLPNFENFSTGPPQKIHRSFGSTYPYDPDPGRKNLAPFGGAIPGSHAVSNGNFSTSQPLTGNVKLELPSLQYQEPDLISWLTCPSTPPLEAVDQYIQFPPEAASVQSDCVSPRNSGLLEAIFDDAQTRSVTKNQQSGNGSSPSVLTPNNMVESSTLDLYYEDWEEYSGPLSPLGLTAASVFSETPPISGSSSDEFPPSEAPSVSEIMLANAEHVSTPSAADSDVRSRYDYLRPDALLGSAWFDESSGGAKEQSILTNTLSTVLGGELCNEYEHISGGAKERSILTNTLSTVLGGELCNEYEHIANGTLSSRFAQELELDSYPWNNMPRICQMHEMP